MRAAAMCRTLNPFHPSRTNLNCLIDHQSAPELRFESDNFEPLPGHDAPVFEDAPVFDDDAEPNFGEHSGVEVLPSGLLYRSYIAGEKEPRFQSIWLNETGRGRVWETQMGGRVGILRKGIVDGLYTKAWQLDMEGGAQTRVDPQQKSDQVAKADTQFDI